MRPHPFHVARLLAPSLLAAAAARPGASWRQRLAASTALVGVWTAVYARYRRRGVAETARERELLATATREALERHYNECVPTIEEEFDIWGDYHASRHEMRYDLVGAALRRHVRPDAAGPGAAGPGAVGHGAVGHGAAGQRARILDLGCGAALVADRLADLPVDYVGIEYGDHQLRYAAQRARNDPAGGIRRRFVRGDAEHLPFRDASVDVVVMSEVIEHLVRPELAVWEIARVLRVGGVLVMTTNNASEMPLYSPVSHLFAWLEKAIGFHHDRLISHRPWVWPEPVSRALLPDAVADVYLPHTWHKQAETRRMFAAAGLETRHASTFEFPPPQSRTSRRLSENGEPGRRVADAIEAVCTRLPLVNRLGCHVLMVATRVAGGLPAPPPGIWPGPFSPQVPRPRSAAAGSSAAQSTRWP